MKTTAATHTPGPWMLVPKGGPQGPFFGAINSRGNVIALQIVNESDARLIAAAPDLYAALVTLIHNGPIPKLGTEKRAYKTAAEAIAKAEGREP